MHIACWITKTTNTHSEYVMLIAFPLQQWLHERASILRYKYIACLVFIWGTALFTVRCCILCEGRLRVALFVNASTVLRVKKSESFNVSNPSSWSKGIKHTISRIEHLYPFRFIWKQSTIHVINNRPHKKKQEKGTACSSSKEITLFCIRDRVQLLTWLQNEDTQKQFSCNSLLSE